MSIRDEELEAQRYREAERKEAREALSKSWNELKESWSQLGWRHVPALLMLAGVIALFIWAATNGG